MIREPPCPMRNRLCSSLLVLVLAAALPDVSLAAQPPEKTKPKPMIGSSIFKWEDLQVRTTPNGERRDVANNPTPTLAVFECHITTLNPGRASHEPHRHPQEELILVKDGTLEVHINGQTQT